MGATGRESLEPPFPRLHLDHSGDDMPVGDKDQEARSQEDDHAHCKDGHLCAVGIS